MYNVFPLLRRGTPWGFKPKLCIKWFIYILEMITAKKKLKFIIVWFWLTNTLNLGHSRTSFHIDCDEICSNSDRSDIHLDLNPIGKVMVYKSWSEISNTSYTLVCRIEAHARLLILRKKSPLHGLISVCTFIDFEKKFPPTCLFGSH